MAQRRERERVRLGDNNFFNLFKRLLASTNPDRDRDEWQIAGVTWRRKRSIQWASHSFQIETHELVHASRPRWSLLLVQEVWWGTDRRKSIRNAHWVHLQNGARIDVLRWFAKRQEELDNR
jgi:hypothetical protein